MQLPSLVVAPAAYPQLHKVDIDAGDHPLQNNLVMAKLHTLPVEIICHTFSHADQVSQKALRLTNRQLGDIGKRSVFQAASVTTSDESLERLNHILDKPGSYFPYHQNISEPLR